MPDPALLNLGCGVHYAPGWTNLDVAERDDTHPDLIVTADDPFAMFPPRSARKVYAGHLLEHVAWPDVPALLAQIRAVLKPGGELLVVGPDTARTLARWKQGLDPEWLVWDVLENQHRGEPGDPGVHKWNASEARVVGLLEAAGFTDVTGLPVTPDALTGWPNTVFSEWQMAVHATA